MTLNKRKRMQVNDAVQKLANLRLEVRKNRQSGKNGEAPTREDEVVNLHKIGGIIQKSKSELGVTEEFDHRLDTFDTELIECHQKDAVKVNGKWTIVPDEKKKEKLRMEIERMKNIMVGTFQHLLTGKTIREEKWLTLTKKEQKEYRKFIEHERLPRNIEERALTGEFADSEKRTEHDGETTSKEVMGFLGGQRFGAVRNLREFP
jgi:hypothetical protein